MPIVYEYWQHRATAEVWAVKLRDGRLIGAAQIGPRDVDEELLPHLRYQTYDLDLLEKRRDDFRRIDGRRIA
jgi:hypothetical protein